MGLCEAFACFSLHKSMHTLFLLSLLLSSRQHVDIAWPNVLLHWKASLLSLVKLFLTIKAKELCAHYQKHVGEASVMWKFRMILENPRGLPVKESWCSPGSFVFCLCLLWDQPLPRPLCLLRAAVEADLTRMTKTPGSSLQVRWLFYILAWIPMKIDIS